MSEYSELAAEARKNHRNKYPMWSNQEKLADAIDQLESEVNEMEPQLIQANKEADMLADWIVDYEDHVHVTPRRDVWEIARRRANREPNG